jgi:hypothetical protein
LQQKKKGKKSGIGKKRGLNVLKKIEFELHSKAMIKMILGQPE